MLSPSLSCTQPRKVADYNPHVAPAPRRGGLDVTFIVAADTHFGYRDIAKTNKRQIRAMNAVAGKSYPGGIGGKVSRPEWVIVAGDLTDNGRKGEWEEFESHYGFTGKDALLKFPVYAGTGNHDRWSGDNGIVMQKVRARHGSLYYSWNHGDLHTICLDEAPNKKGLFWLKKDLADTGTDRPIIIFLHFPFTGPYSDSNWFGDEEKEQFAEAMEGFNVIGIFHGHYHASSHYEWKGFDIYNVGSPKHSWRSFAVVHVTDSRLTVVERHWGGLWDYWGWKHSKAIN